MERVRYLLSFKICVTLFCRFIREFKDVCLQEGENGNKTFWNAVKSLGRDISLISKPEAQAVVRAHERNGSNLNSQFLLGQGGRSAVAEATAVKVDTAHCSLEMRLRPMPSSPEINRTPRVFAKLAFVTDCIPCISVVIAILNRLIVFPTILQASLRDHHVPVQRQTPQALEPLGQQVHRSLPSWVDQLGPA